MPLTRQDVAEPLRLTVAGESRRADLVVPASLPVAQLLPDLAELVGTMDGFGTTPRLLTTTGEVLQPGLGLEDQGIVDGAVLLLTRTGPPPVVVYDDLVEAVDVVGAEDPPAERKASGSLACGVVLLSLAAGCLPLVAPPAPSAVGVGGIGVLLLTVAILSASPSDDLWSALPGWASAACGAAAAVLSLPVDASPSTRVAVAGLGGLVPAVLALLASGTALNAMLPVALVMTAAGCGGLVLAVTGVPSAGVLAAGLVAAALSVDAFPAVALRVGSIRAPQVVPDGLETTHHPVDVAKLESGLRVADGLVVLLYAALALASLLLAPVAAWSGAGCAALLLAVNLRFVLQAGVLRCAAVSRAALLSGLVGLLALVVAAIWLQPTWRGPLAVTLVVAGALVCSASGLPHVDTPGRARLLEIAEGVVLASLLPLATLGSGLLVSARG